MSTCRMGQVSISRGKDFPCMRMVRCAGLFFDLLMALAAIFRCHQCGNCFTIVLESIDIAFFSLVTIKAANAILAVTRILPL